MTGKLRPLRSMVLSFAALPLAAPAAGAAEICISCVGPDVTYRCSAEGFSSTGPTDARLQLLCITELAKSGGHQSCSADRSKLANCEGVLRVVTPPQPVTLPPPNQTAAAPPPPPVEGVTTIPKNSDVEAAPPATVEQMAKEAARSSKDNLDKVGKSMTDTAKSAGQQIENAGDAVGSAAKKTWDCVASLFKEC